MIFKRKDCFYMPYSPSLSVKKRPHLFLKYILSYICIAVLSCTLIGFFLFGIFLQDLVNETRQTNQQKLTIALDDMENQLELLQDLTIKLSYNPIYKPSLLNNDPYARMELLKNFEIYQTVSPLTTEYFLVYHQDTGRIYRSNGRTLPLDIYIRDILKSPDAPGLTGQLTKSEKFQILVPAGCSSVLLAYPVHMDGNPSGNATMCFIIERSALLQRIQNTTGGFEGSIELFLDGIRLADSRPEESPVTEQISLRSANSADSRFEMILYYSNSAAYRNFSGFCLTSILLIGLTVFFLLGVAILAAYRNFRPIGQLNTRLAAQGFICEPGKNELENIESVVLHTLEHNLHANQQLAEQMRELRNQGLSLLLSGDCSENIVQRLRLLGLPFSSEYYAVLQIQLTDIECADILEPLEDLSGDGLYFYPVHFQQNSPEVTVILELQEKGQASEACELCESLLTSRKISAILGLGSVYEQLCRLPASYLEATANCSHQGKSPQKGEELQFYDSRYVGWMLQAVRSENYCEACRWLDALMEELNRSAPSFLMRRYIYSDIMVMLVNAGRELKIPISQKQVSYLLCVQNENTFQEDVQSILEILCKRGTDIADTDEQEVARQVLSYIAAHFNEYDLSLERLSHEFSRSMDSIRRLVKRVSGENYKDYVILLRIEYSKQLLKKGNSVADTCEKIGYTNVSHFIRIFKKYVGTTPSAYQQSNLLDFGKEDN